MANPQLQLNGTSSSSTHRLANGSTDIRQRHDRSIATQASSEGSKSAIKVGRRRSKGKGRAYNPPWNTTQWVKEGFRRFGEHCARNQIRTLLIDCLVMTHLFYPSLAFYLQKKFPPLRAPIPPSHEVHRRPAQTTRSAEHPLSLLSTPILDSFFPYPPPLLPRLPIMRSPLAGHEHDGFHLQPIFGDDIAVGDAMNDIAVMRVGWADVVDVLDGDANMSRRAWAAADHALLNQFRQTAESWGDEQAGNPGSCVRQLEVEAGSVTSDGRCFILSTEDNETFAPSDAHRLISPPESSVYHSASILFRIPHTSREAFVSAWAQHLSRIANETSAEVFAEPGGFSGGRYQEHGEWLVSYSQTSSGQETAQAIQQYSFLSAPWIVYVTYAVILTALTLQISNATKAHSRFGLAFTGIVQLCCSTVMSFSVLSLFGWNGWGASLMPTTLPTYFLPFVIVVVGVENMSMLTKAVFSVPFTYAVPERIGVGLSRVGVRIASTSLQDLLLMGTLWLLVDLQPVREFCVFAATVVITDWFMLHTFFLTVLSIDAQRLELADILSTAPAVVTPPQNKLAGDVEDQTPLFSWRRLLRTRSIKTFSLLFLCLCVYVFHQHQLSPASTTASLYGYRSLRSNAADPSASAAPLVSSLRDLAVLSPAEKLWHTLNPSGWPSIRLIAPRASIIILPRKGHPMRPIDLHQLQMPASRLLLPRLKPLFYLFKVVILPQAVTATALYFLLRFLLKDAELLDAQRNKLGRNEDAVSGATDEHSDGTSTIRAALEVQMLPCSHSSDIELLVSSGNGEIGLSVSLDSRICLWRFSSKLGTGTREYIKVPPGEEDMVVTAIAVSKDGKYIAVATSKPAILIWNVPEVASPKFDRSFGLDKRHRVTDLLFDSSTLAIQDPFLDPSSPSNSPPNVIVTSGGSVYALSTDGELAAIASVSADERSCVIPDAAGGVTAMLVDAEGSLQLTHRTPHGWTSVELRSSPGRATSFCRGKLSFRGATIECIAVGGGGGRIDIADESGATIAALAFEEGPITQLALSPSSSPTLCSSCGVSINEGAYIMASTPSRIHISHIHPHGATWCKCGAPATRRTSSNALNASPARTPRAPPFVLPPVGSTDAAGGSPVRSPGLLPPSNGEFPLSSHGARRLSNLNQKEDGDARRPPSPLDKAGMAPTSLALTPSHANGSAAASTNGNEKGLDWEVRSLGSILSAHGGWQLVDGHTVLGIRRSGPGIDDTNWQIFSIDLRAPWNGHNLIVSSVNLATCLLDTLHRLPMPRTEVTMRERRAERLLSLEGRATFPSITPQGSLSMPLSPAMAYVDVRPVVRKGSLGLLAAFGNRLGVIQFRKSAVDPSIAGRRKTSASALSPGGFGGPSLTPPLPLPPPPSALRPPPPKRVESASSGGSDQDVRKNV